MTAIDNIRKALAALDESWLKPWVQLDRLPYLHATDDPNAEVCDGWVVGRFDYPPTMHYIKYCNPAAMAEVLAHIDAQQAEIERLQRGEYICQKCGIRKDADSVPSDF